MGDDLPGLHPRKRGNLGDPHGSDKVVQTVCFCLSKKMRHRMVLQAAQVKKAGCRKMGPGVAAGVHIQIRSKIWVHVAAVCLIIGQNIPGLERGCTARIYDRFRKKHQAMIPQKLFMGIILQGKIGHK